MSKSSPPFPSDTTFPTPLGKNNTYLLHQPKDIHVHLPRAVWIHDIDTTNAQENILCFKNVPYTYIHGPRKPSVHRCRQLYVLFVLCADRARKVTLSLSDSPAMLGVQWLLTNRGVVV